MLVWKRTSGRPFFFFFFNDTATTEIYTLSLHDALPICHRQARASTLLSSAPQKLRVHVLAHADVVHQIPARVIRRSEEHTSELQSQSNLVCRLLLEKKKRCRNEQFTLLDHYTSQPLQTK